MWLILYYIVALVIPNICAKFHNVKKSLTKNVHTNYIGVRDGKMKNAAK